MGRGERTFIIAEAGVNHNGDIAIAKKLVETAAAAGADAVKFQTFKADKVAIPAAPKAEYQLRTTGAEESQLEMLRRLELSANDHRILQSHCREHGILFMSTPFDRESVDLLEELRVPAFKIGSGDLTNWPLLEYVGRKGKPVILSTGMSYLEEVEEAVKVILSSGSSGLALLHCTSSYPAVPGEANLLAMRAIASACRLPVGYSDHTLGIEVALAAVALGACIIEKHFTLDRNLPGPDHQASLEPAELSALIRGIRSVEAALGHGRKEPTPRELSTAQVARRSLVAACDIPAASVLTDEMVAIRRPGTGLQPGMLPYLLGRKAKKDIPAGTLLTLEMLS